MREGWYVFFSCNYNAWTNKSLFLDIQLDTRNNYLISHLIYLFICLDLAGRTGPSTSTSTSNSDPVPCVFTEGLFMCMLNISVMIQFQFLLLLVFPLELVS